MDDKVESHQVLASVSSLNRRQVTSGFLCSLRKNKNKTDEVQKALDRNLQTLSEAMQELNATVSPYYVF